MSRLIKEIKDNYDREHGTTYQLFESCWGTGISIFLREDKVHKFEVVIHGDDRSSGVLVKEINTIDDVAEAVREYLENL